MAVGRIQTVEDLRNEISRADTDADRATIYTRAAYLGLRNKLPHDWNADGSLKNEG